MIIVGSTLIKIILNIFKLKSFFFNMANCPKSGKSHPLFPGTLHPPQDFWSCLTSPFGGFFENGPPPPITLGRGGMDTMYMVKWDYYLKLSRNVFICIFKRNYTECYLPFLSVSLVCQYVFFSCLFLLFYLFYSHCLFGEFGICLYIGINCICLFLTVSYLLPLSKHSVYPPPHPIVKNVPLWRKILSPRGIGDPWEGGSLHI